MNKIPACKINGLKYPAADNISSRTSTLCRSMACTLLIRESCTPEYEREWMKFFPKKICAYCGRPATHLDHLYALIIDRKPTGYGTEPGNLVPCCGKCNQPKGNTYWEDFMRSDKCNHVGSVKNSDPQKAMEERIKIITDFQSKMQARHVTIDASLMSEWEKMLNNLDSALNDAQKMLLIMKQQLYKGQLNSGHLQSRSKPIKSNKNTASRAGKNNNKSMLKNDSFTEDEILEIAVFYMRNNLSFADMDKKFFNIHDQHGNKSCNLLKKLGIRGAQKGLLKYSDIDTEISNATGQLKDTLIKIKTKGL